MRRVVILALGILGLACSPALAAHHAGARHRPPSKPDDYEQFLLGHIPLAFTAQVPGGGIGALTVASCGAQSYGAGLTRAVTQDLTGALCTNANSGAITVNQGTSPWIVDTTGSGVLDGELTAPIAAQIAAGVLIGSTQISDGACSSSPCATNATVLAASTAAAVTNKSLAVQLVPQQQTIGGANPGRTYNTVAASQTSQKLSSTQGGGTGASGDYLSHCVVVPATTSPGAVTIADGSTAVYSFPGGTVTSVISWPVPVGAVTTTGAWEVTTGTNVSVFCSGKFT